METALIAERTLDGRYVLVVDDDPAICDFVVRVLENDGLACCCAGSLEDARVYPDLDRVALVILDLSLGGGDAVDVLEHLANHDYAGGVALITGFDIAALDPVQRLGTMIGLTMWPSLTKPIRPADLRGAVQSLVMS